MDLDNTNESSGRGAQGASAQRFDRPCQSRERRRPQESVARSFHGADCFDRRDKVNRFFKGYNDDISICS